ncbi:type II toxin-antitoxin system CcdA family antitoxin [Halomonas sp. NO4]|uniref:type II toxin-antitoxin system CcdA family antitoxin n=1 Tax=Halomonas sp. NO4 TaxID=2484813 RepID=UPI0013D1B24A|nr:type II toxin-antitoxin system CcdA family antitoxin [Halomonas sp. NO4]
MHQIYDTCAPKKPTNLSINSDLLEIARSLSLNLSATLGIALAEQVRAEQCAQWQRENAGTIQAYNQYVEENDTFGDDERTLCPVPSYIDTESLFSPPKTL